jgi:SPP1 family phage portal protein
MVINPADKDFATTSGIALQYKILAMEWLAAEIEAYVSMGLQRRLMLIANAIESLGRGDPWPVTINFRRNIPINLQAMAETAGMLRGILSERTIINTFPADVVPDKVAELERLDEERAGRLPMLDDSTNNV